MQNKMVFHWRISPEREDYKREKQMERLKRVSKTKSQLIYMRYLSTLSAKEFYEEMETYFKKGKGYDSKVAYGVLTLQKGDKNGC